MSHKIIIDRKIFGPGMWISIHILAYDAKTKDDQLSFCKIVRTLCSNLPCHNCRAHATEFIDNNPPEILTSDTDETAMFKWSCDLHNNANTKKIPPSPLLNWEPIYKEYAQNAPKKEKDEISKKSQSQKMNTEIYNRMISKLKNTH